MQLGQRGDRVACQSLLWEMFKQSKFTWPTVMEVMKVRVGTQFPATSVMWWEVREHVTREERVEADPLCDKSPLRTMLPINSSGHRPADVTTCDAPASWHFYTWGGVEA